MMNPEIVVIPFVFGLPAALVALRMVLGYRERQANRRALPASTVAELDARLARLETAVDTVAVEVERMSEGIRFTTRLLSERAGAPVAASSEPRRPDRPVTPH